MENPKETNIFSLFRHIYVAHAAFYSSATKFTKALKVLNIPVFPGLYKKSRNAVEQVFGSLDPDNASDEVYHATPAGLLLDALYDDDSPEASDVKLLLMLRTDTPAAALIIDIGLAENAPSESITSMLPSFTSLPIDEMLVTMYNDFFLNSKKGKELVHTLLSIFDKGYSMDQELLELYSPKPGVYKRWLVGAPLNLDGEHTMGRIFDDAVMNYELATSDIRSCREPDQRNSLAREVKLWFDILSKSLLIQDKLKTSKTTENIGSMPVQLRLQSLPATSTADPDFSLSIKPGDIFSSSPYIGGSTEPEYERIDS